MPTTAQLNYAKYLISNLRVSEQRKSALREEVESMNLDAAIGFIDSLKSAELEEWFYHEESKDAKSKEENK